MKLELRRKVESGNRLPFTDCSNAMSSTNPFPASSKLPLKFIKHTASNMRLMLHFTCLAPLRQTSANIAAHVNM